MLAIPPLLMGRLTQIFGQTCSVRHFGYLRASVASEILESRMEPLVKILNDASVGQQHMPALLRSGKTHKKAT